MEENNNSNNTNTPVYLRWVTYTKKDGTIVKKQYDNRPYMLKYREKNHSKIFDAQECEICHGSYNAPNKAKHCRTTRHIKCYEALKEKGLIE